MGLCSCLLLSGFKVGREFGLSQLILESLCSGVQGANGLWEGKNKLITCQSVCTARTVRTS